jgi:hypothetical protein
LFYVGSDIVIKNRIVKAIIRWIARITGTLIILFFIVFGIGEGMMGPFVMPEWYVIVMKLFIPGMLIVGIIVAWFRETVGGVIIISSVLMYNLAGMIITGDFGTFHFDFAWLLILALLFLLSPKKSDDKNQVEKNVE